MIIPSIFKYEDYFSFLKEVYEVNKKSNPSFSYEAFARQLKVPKSLIYDVITYRKSISLKKFYNFVENLKLSDLEVEYFISLYLMSSENDRIKEVFKNRHKKRFIKEEDISDIRSIELHDPLMISILAVLRVSEFLPSPKEMKIKIKVAQDLKEEKIKDCYDYLIRKNVLRVKEDNRITVEKGTYFVFGKKIKNRNDFFSGFDKNAQAFINLLEEKKKPEGPFGFDGLYLNLSLEEAQELADELLFLRNRLSKIEASPFDDPPRKTYQVDFRIFPIT